MIMWLKILEIDKHGKKDISYYVHEKKFKFGINKTEKNYDVNLNFDKTGGGEVEIFKKEEKVFLKKSEMEFFKINNSQQQENLIELKENCFISFYNCYFDIEITKKNKTKQKSIYQKDDDLPRSKKLKKEEKEEVPKKNYYLPIGTLRNCNIKINNK
ncbi:hypothetical protein DICPUDRAFT_80395 [Dictyostelium purpureum]|uniref:Uncharacterized protein n=1 Tax=Dictyostelium purpureum TaxID=5786 RepID=F0ZQC5_DICPU|nr:uncharacterized protein DICPUDRAFT_80395 [Dictyostelium purpureum]EGC33881.1 hypothetical protein DICPUDRAFT_80395 [Dictyostelium purpureum]|eukprot:XP_003289619.1 hypothetical protein DICPUDRAFT_80395 [Dictyostelium purpureum]